MVAQHLAGYRALVRVAPHLGSSLAPVVIPQSGQARACLSLPRSAAHLAVARTNGELAARQLVVQRLVAHGRVPA